MPCFPPACLLFPHLYRCGHIEAPSEAAALFATASNFRIFIDAATLKLEQWKRDAAAAINFRIFIDAATLKPDSMTNGNART